MQNIQNNKPIFAIQGEEFAASMRLYSRNRMRRDADYKREVDAVVEARKEQARQRWSANNKGKKANNASYRSNGFQNKGGVGGGFRENHPRTQLMAA